MLLICFCCFLLGLSIVAAFVICFAPVLKPRNPWRKP